jgi:hypothetical protein
MSGNFGLWILEFENYNYRLQNPDGAEVAVLFI